METKTTFFTGKNGQITSMRVRNGSMDMTNHIGSTGGGTTFRNKNFTTRINNRGQVIGTGMKTGKHTTYMNNSFRKQSQLTPF